MGLDSFKTEDSSKSSSQSLSSSKVDEETMSFSYKYDANPTDEQQEVIRNHFEVHKNIYNKALETLNSSDEFISKYEMQKHLTDWKKTSNPEFSNVHAKAAQRTIHRLYEAISGLSAKKENGEKVGRLRYKNRFSSIEYNQSGFKIKDDHIYLSKIGDIPVNFHREVPEEAKVKGVIIKEYSCNDWKVILQLEVPRPDKQKITENSDIVGIDLNVSNFCVDSEGLKIKSLRNRLKSKWERVKRAQKDLSRKQKGSENYKKNKQRLAKKHRELRNARRDFLHKLSRWYVDNYDVIVVEDLESKELGESESSELNRHIANHAWSEFTSMLVYKAQQAGKHVIEVDPDYTSQDCSNPECDNRVDKQLHDRTHECSECGLEVDRDYNAAVNIYNRAIQLIGKGLTELTPVDTLSSGELSNSSPRQVVEAGSPGFRPE